MNDVRPFESAIQTICGMASARVWKRIALAWSGFFPLSDWRTIHDATTAARKTGKTAEKW